MKAFISMRYILFVAVALRMLLPLLSIITNGSNEQFHARDTGSFIRPAVALITVGQFARDDEPEIMRTPGYPILLIPGIALGHIELVTITLQIALSALTVFLVYRITLLLFERTAVAVAAAMLYAIEPLSILYSSILLSETFFTTLLTAFIYFIIKYWKQGSLIHLVISAAALAAAAYVRPIAYYLPILTGVLLLLGIPTKRRMNSQRLTHLGVFLLVSIGLMGIWQIRNQIETGYLGFSSAAEESLYYWDAAAVLAALQETTPREARELMGFYDEEIYFQNFPDQREWGESEIINSMGSQGREIILSNLGTYSILAFKGSLRTLLDPPASDFMRMLHLDFHPDGWRNLIVEQGPGRAVGFLFKQSAAELWVILILRSIVLIYLVLAAIGLSQSGMNKSAPVILIAILTVYFIVISAVGIGDDRARHPIMPMICIFAGYGLFRIISKFRIRRLFHQANPIPTT